MSRKNSAQLNVRMTVAERMRLEAAVAKLSDKLDPSAKISLARWVLNQALKAADEMVDVKPASSA